MCTIAFVFLSAKSRSPWVFEGIWHTNGNGRLCFSYIAFNGYNREGVDDPFLLVLGVESLPLLHTHQNGKMVDLGGSHSGSLGFL